METENKQKSILELRDIISKIDIDKLVESPDKALIDQGIFRAEAILTNFDHPSGEGLKSLIKEFLEIARAGKRIKHARNLANDIKNLITQKTEEMDLYEIGARDTVFQDMLKKLIEVQDLISQGLARPEEKTKVIKEARQKSQLFQDELYRRRAEKLEKKTIWTHETRDGFVSPKESKELQPWIELFRNYLGQRRIKRKLKKEGLWIQSTIEGKDEHLLIGKRDGKGDKVHLVSDSETGEIRIDRKDQVPHELVKQIETVLTLKNGEKVRFTRSKMEFIEGNKLGPKISIYPSDKGNRFLLEVYNSGNEDVDNIVIKVFWKQPDGQKERVLEKFIGENEDPVMTYPHRLNVLKKEERKFAVNIPSISTDKKIKVSVSCKGISSNREFTEEFEFETPNQYK